MSGRPILYRVRKGGNPPRDVFTQDPEMRGLREMVDYKSFYVYGTGTCARLSDCVTEIVALNRNWGDKAG